MIGYRLEIKFAKQWEHRLHELYYIDLRDNS